MLICGKISNLIIKGLCSQIWGFEEDDADEHEEDEDGEDEAEESEERNPEERAEDTFTGPGEVAAATAALLVSSAI